MSAHDLALPTIQDAVGAFVDEVVLPHVAEWDRDDVLPDEVWEQLVALGVPGALVPEEHGGAGRTVAAMVPVWRTLSQGWISLTGAVNPTGLATALLTRDGTPEQRERWLPRFADGTAHAAFSITEPQAGSDLSRIATTARVERGGVMLDGRMRWVAGGVSRQHRHRLSRHRSGRCCLQRRMVRAHRRPQHAR
ncbi:MAG: acyl-CoA dehydrogenase family protein, partial [Baekduiaceae bacterium]